MATRKTAKKTKPAESVSFNGPAGETTIPIYEGMYDDLPPMTQVRFTDLAAAADGGAMGTHEWLIKVAAMFTHLPDVPPNQRLDQRLLDRVTDKDLLLELFQAGATIVERLNTDFAAKQDEGGQEDPPA